MDTAQPGRGHRLNLLNSDVKEVGYGLATGDWTTGGFTYKSVMVTEDFTKSSLSPILTGVVYQDRDANNFYTPGGEGMAGVTIVAESPLGLTLQTATFPSGGYSLTLEPGPYHVTFQGSGIETQGFDVVVGRDNIKLDLPLLTSDSPNEAPWKNQDNALDVNADGLVEPLDVLLLVNQLNSSGGGELPELSDLASPPPFVDVSGDNVLAALDVLIVVNKLNSETSVLAPTPMLDLRAALSTTAVPEPTTGWLAAVAGALVCLRQLIRSRRKVA